MKIDKWSYRNGDVRFLRVPRLPDIDDIDYHITEYDYLKKEDRIIIEMYLENAELRNKIKELKKILR